MVVQICRGMFVFKKLTLFPFNISTTLYINQVSGNTVHLWPRAVAYTLTQQSFPVSHANEQDE
jgi:hypothetical protein